MLRNYTDTDYENLKALYQHSEWFGGQFEEARDSRQRLAKIIVRDPHAIIVEERDGEIVGSISLFEDGRAAWLFRFVVKDNDMATAKALYAKATEILKERGHEQVLSYAPVGDMAFYERYVRGLGMQKGSDYTCYWAEL